MAAVFTIAPELPFLDALVAGLRAQAGADPLALARCTVLLPTRRAARAWGLEILCRDPKCYSPVLTAIMMPAGHDADAFRKVVLEHFDMSLGSGLSKLAGKVFRIGHLGDTNDLTILGALSGVEMGLELAGVPHNKGGAQAAMDYLAQAAGTPMESAAE